MNITYTKVNRFLKDEIFKVGFILELYKKGAITETDKKELLIEVEIKDVKFNDGFSLETLHKDRISLKINDDRFLKCEQEVYVSNYKIDSISGKVLIYFKPYWMAQFEK
jgi:hypothetical protein